MGTPSWDTICQICAASWHFAMASGDMPAECGHPTWFLSASYCGECSRLQQKCQCCGKFLFD